MKKFKNFLKKNQTDLIQIGIMIAMVATPSIMPHAEATMTSSSTMPWSTGINLLQAELTGPLPKIASVIAVAVAGAMMTFGEMSGMTKKAIQVVFGLAVALGASTFVATMSGQSVTGSTF